jgi:hypothetical protein
MISTSWVRSLLTVALIAGLGAPALAYVTDAATHAPPTAGALAIGAFTPDQSAFPRVGQTFVDPMFGSTIRRLTNELGRPSVSDIYGKNGYWNADGTRMFHNDGNGKQILDTATGAVVRAPAPGNFDGSFAPDDADTWYYFEGASLKKFSVSTGATSLVKTFASTLGYLGGSTDWVDRSGRYMLLNVGGSLRVWDKQADVLYAGAIPGNVDTGWAGIAPDAGHVVVTGDEKNSYAINHATRTLSTTPVMFWSLCASDHGDLVSATNGKTYLITFECHSDPGIWAVDITIRQTPADYRKQQADNRKLFGLAWTDWGHFAGAARGVLQDWVYVSVESTDATLAAGVSTWRPYKQEIVMADVLTGEVRRLAHHRSWDITASYYYQPRVSASWDGTRIAWLSNFGHEAPDYADIYSILVAPGPGTPPLPAVPSLTFTNPASGATVSGMRTVTLAATGGSGADYTYSLAVDGANVYTGTKNTVSWNTVNHTNAVHTLTATVTDGAGKTATADRSVTVANVATPPPAKLTVTMSAPKAKSTVSGTVKVVVGASGATAGPRTFTLFVDGKRVASKAVANSATISWNTTAVADGRHTLRVKVVDAAGNTTSLSRAVTVIN